MAIHRIKRDQALRLHVATTAEISFRMRLYGFFGPFLVGAAQFYLSSGGVEAAIISGRCGQNACIPLRFTNVPRDADGPAGEPAR
jgi:hypothetical protein